MFDGHDLYVAVMHCILTFFILFQMKGKGKGKVIPKGKKIAAAPLVTKKPPPPKKVVNPLFEKRPRNFGIGEIVFFVRLGHFISCLVYLDTEIQNVLSF